MPARYHPISDSLWGDVKLEGAPFEERGFFAFLCSNVRQRPSGIYRVSDEQLAADTGMRVRRVKRYLIDLETRGLVTRDGRWMFVHSYFARQPHQDRLLAAVRDDVAQCDSVTVLTAFVRRYPEFYSLLPPDRQATVGPTVGRPSGDGQAMGERKPFPMQSRAEQSNTEQSNAEPPECSQVSEASTSTTGNGTGPHEPPADEVSRRRQEILTYVTPVPDIAEVLLRVEILHYREHQHWPTILTPAEKEIP